MTQNNKRSNDLQSLKQYRKELKDYSIRTHDRITRGRLFEEEQRIQFHINTRETLNKTR